MTATTDQRVADEGLIGRLTAGVLRHRRLVIVAWLVLLVAGGAGAGHLSSRLSVDFSLPGQPGYETSTKILHSYGNGAQSPPSILAVTVPAGETVRQDESRIAAAFRSLRAHDPRLRIVDYATTHDAVFLTSDGRTTYSMVFGPPYVNFQDKPISDRLTGELRADLPSTYHVGATGLNELASSSGKGGTGVFAETLIGGLGALAVLAFVFASILALVPLLIAAVSITSTLLVVLGLTYIAPVSFIVQFLVSLVGLGVAIDYSLLVVTRWREERQRGHDNATATQIAMRTAGRAVVVSGGTVAIGLVALIVLPVPGLRSVGYGGMLIPLVSTLVTLTLLPALLGGIGPRIDWPRLRHDDRASRGWTGWGRFVVRRRWLAAGAALVALGICIAPVFSLTTGSTSVDALTKTGQARATYDALRAGGMPTGALTPLEVLTARGSADAAAATLDHVDGITAAAVSTAPDSSRNNTTIVIGVPTQATLNNTTLAPVSAARHALAKVSGVAGIAGEGPIELDYQHAVFGNFPVMFAVIAVLMFLLLARAFRSVLLPLKALVLNLLSMAATFGLMTWFWQEGHGSDALFGVPATGAITFWVPLMVFAFLFGLSMDYEVFILARMREHVDAGNGTDAAVVEGIGRTGRLVTSAALILFLAFASLASAPFTDLKVLATGLGAGILLDATVVRALLLPALVSLFGRWNWWMPSWLARVLRIDDHPTTPAERELVPA
ncbi:MAG TPA: MMPL family transporter [Mycobacteriales bacterium]|nr:MMPL family transporter [Mycobacteriales bacterium]